MMFANFNAKPFVQLVMKGHTNTGVTLVAFPMSDRGTVTHIEDARSVMVAIAQCGEKDHYCKRTGRELASNQAFNGQGFVVRFPKDADFFDKSAILRNMAFAINGDL